MRHAVLPLMTTLVVGCTAQSAVTPSSTTTQPPGATGSITGVAKYDGLYSHAGIQVQIASGSLQVTALTDSKGAYQLSPVPPGSYQLTFSRAGYYPQTLSVRLATASTSVSPVTLTDHRQLYASTSLYDRTLYLSRTSLVLAPDRAHLAFVEGGKLVRIDLDGSEPTVLRGFQPPATESIDSFDWTSAGLVFAQVGTGSSRILRTTGSDVTGALTEATHSTDLLEAPVYSPDGSAIAYLDRQPVPWTSNGATGSAQLAIYRQALGDSSLQTVGTLPISELYDYAFGPLTWTPSGLLCHVPMFCNLQNHANSGDGIYLVSPDNLSTALSTRMKKLWYYSDFEHCLSNDGTTLYFHHGFNLKARKVDDPGGYDQDAAIAGYDGSTTIGNMVMGPNGDRIYYVSGRGVEEMLLAP